MDSHDHVVIDAMEAARSSCPDDWKAGLSISYPNLVYGGTLNKKGTPFSLPFVGRQKV